MWEAIAKVYRALRDTREGGHSYVSLALLPSLSGVHEVFHVFMLRSILQIQLMYWIGASLLLMHMGPSRRDLCIFWIVETRFYDIRL